MTRCWGVRHSVAAFAVSLAAVTYLDRVCISILAPQIMHDLGLSRMIDFADEVVAPFRGNRQGFEAVETADDDFAGGAGGADGDIEKRMHGKMSSAETYQPIVAD